MATIRANGIDIAYAVDGAGPPLIALHGASGSGAEHYATLLPALREGFRVHLPDARGHAGTAWDPADGWTALDLVADVLAFADALGLPSFHLIGYSMGGMTALQVAARHPERLRTLVAVSIAPDREPRRSVGRRVLDPDRIERDDPRWARRLEASHNQRPGDGRWRRLLGAIAADLDTQPLLSAAELRRIDAPMLVAAGDRDPFVPVDQARALARQVRDGRLLILPAVDHEALVDRAGLLTAALAEFYRSTADVAERRAAAVHTRHEARKETA